MSIDLPAPLVALATVRAWRWPLPRLDGEEPRILSTWNATRDDGLVVLGYPLRTESRERVPVLAPADGALTFAGRTGLGATACLDHAGRLATLVSGLETLLVPATHALAGRRPRVRAGDVLGYLRSPLALGFRLARREDDAWSAIDPAPLARAWSVQPWFTSPAQDARACGASP